MPFQELIVHQIRIGVDPHGYRVLCQVNFPVPEVLLRRTSLFTTGGIPPSMRGNSSWKCAGHLRTTAEFRETYQRDL
jgi:hypothetical protein